MEPFECPHRSRSAEVCVVQKWGASLLLFFKQCLKRGMMGAMGKKSMSLEAQGGSARKDVRTCVSGSLAM